MRMTYEELIAIPASPESNWDESKVRVGKKKLTIKSALNSWDEACYFAFEKRIGQFGRPFLRIETREINRKDDGYPYNFESIDVPWHVTEKIAEFLAKGPWTREVFHNSSEEERTNPVRRRSQ